MKRYIIVMLAFLVLLGACEIKKPTLPNWDVLLSVPLINEKFYVSDLVDTVNIVVNENQILTLTGSGEVSTYAFGNLNYDPDTNLADQNIPSGMNQVLDPIPFADTSGHLSIAYAAINSGIFRYRFTGVHPSAEITLTFQNLFDSNNNPVVVTNPTSSGWVNLDLQNMHIGHPTDNTVIPGLLLHVNATSTQAPGTPIATFSFQALDPLQFSSFKGYMNGLSIQLKDSTSSITIDYPHNVDESITLREASLKLDIENEVGFGAVFHGSLFAHNEAGETISVPIVDNNGDNFHIDPANAAGSVTTSIEINEGIEPILQMMPDSLQIINGYFTFNSGSTIGEVNSSDRINLDYMVDAPFHFDLHEHEIVVDSIFVLDISEENRNRILNNALAADLTIELLNMLPMGASAKVYFAGNDSIDVHDPSTYSFSKNASVLAATNPNPWQAISLSLTKEELDVFAQPNVYYTWSFSFQELDDVTIYARTSDYIHIRSMVKARIKVEDL